MNIPSIATINTIETDKLQTAITLHQPQIIQHLAFIPIEMRNVNEKLLETLGLIEEFKLEQDMIISDRGDYESAIYENKTGKTVIIPAGTHLKGGHQNRGNNKTEVLGINDEETFPVNCFEPGRGSGGDHFEDFEDVPPDVVQATMTNTSGYEGSWEMIRKYTELVNADESALSTFNEQTADDRAKYALNFETCEGQTGVAIITRDLSMIEIFPTPTTFNIYRQRILRGKVASLFYRLHKSQPTALLLPSEVEGKVNGMLSIVKSAIEQTVDHGTKKQNMIIGRDRDTRNAMDVILTDTAPPQIAYLFGVW